MLGFPNRIDASTISGGSWLAALPLANLKTRTFGEVARSTNLLLASTKFDIDLGSQRNIRALDFRNHNLSLQALYRIRGSDDPTFATSAVDSGWQSVWPTVYPFGSLDWEEDNWFTGTYTEEQRAGYMPSFTHILDANTLSRYWRVEFDDQANSAGYVQLGRVFIGPVWQPTRNMSFGNSLAVETDTAVQAAYSGSEFFDVKTPFRVVRFSLDWMDEDEALGTGFELLRRAGIDQEVLWIHDPSDTVHAIRRRFLGRFRQLSPIENPYVNVGKLAFEIKELQ